ncbi:tetratricopeptide repeat protein [Marinobacter sp. AN1]|uniref:tetratricopeptide repeat protein n=1 Tax=Marinobacter sp. AN1 TaxID=2886046 RepID=UPI0022319C24|nr:tetratricopeptide repeat protein [Marinobacter sp. AN1]UZD67247.1 tetratricopeptide repeat protein [Marinobacter sp. AN1]
MQAQYNVQLSDSQKAQVARLVLEANAAYGESNNAQRRYLERVQARHGCRQLLEQALALEPDHAAAIGLLGRVAMDEGDLDQAAELFEQAWHCSRSSPSSTATWATGP